MATRRSAPAASTTLYFVLGAVLAVPFGVWQRLPGLAFSLGILVIGGLVEPAPVMTGRRVAGRAPLPADEREEHLIDSHRMWRDLRWRLVVPNRDWLPGWPVRLTWLLALTASWFALALPVTKPEYALLDALAAYILAVQIPASRRRSDHDCPGVRLDTFTAGLSWCSTAAIPLGLLAGVAGFIGPQMAHGRWPLVIPAVPVALTVPPLGLAGAAAGLYPTWSSAALTSWRTLVRQAALWRVRWEVLKVDPPPVLLSVSEVGQFVVETFTAPPQEGWAGMRPKSPKLAPLVGGGMSATIIPVLDEANGAPVPGTIHQGRFAVVTAPASLPPIPSLPRATADEVLVAARVAAERACVLLGFSPVVLSDPQPLHADDSETGAWRITGDWPEGPGWVTARSSGWPAEFSSALGVEAVADHRPDTGQILAGDLDDTDWADPASATKVEQIRFEDTWTHRWSAVVKSNVNPPVVAHSETRDITYKGVTIHRAVFQVRSGLNPVDHVNAKTESALKTAIQQVPFVSVTGYPARGGRAGIRHSQAFTVCYSTQAVPASPDRVSDEREGSRVILAAQVNAMFDAARLARPELTEANCLTATVSAFTVASIWRIGLRLYGGVTLADVQAGAERMRAHVGVPWLRVDDAPDGVTLYAGVRPEDGSVKSPRVRFDLARLDWDHAWLAAKVRGHAGLTPSLTAFEDVPTNPAVHVATFELPKGTSVPAIAKALPELRTATGNSFVEIDRERTDASTLVLLVSQHDPMPKSFPWTPDGVTERSNAIPLGVGVSGEPETWDLGNSPHLGVIGKSGSGKSATMTLAITGALLAGWDVVVVDPMKGGADFKFAEDFTLAFADDLASASATMRWVIKEVERRKNLNATHGAPSFADLPATIRPRRLVVVIDEFVSLVEKQGNVPRTPYADPEMEIERLAQVEANTFKDDIGSIAGRISKEARSAGVHLVVGAIKMRTTDLEKVPGGGTLKTSLARMLLGMTSLGDRASALNNADLAPSLDGTIGAGRGLYEPAVGLPRLIQTAFSPTNELAAMIAAVREPVDKVDTGPVARKSTTGTPLVQEVDVDTSWADTPIDLGDDIDLDALMAESAPSSNSELDSELDSESNSESNSDQFPPEDHMPDHTAPVIPVGTDADGVLVDWRLSSTPNLVVVAGDQERIEIIDRIVAAAVDGGAIIATVGCEFEGIEPARSADTVRDVAALSAWVSFTVAARRLLAAENSVATVGDLPDDLRPPRLFVVVDDLAALAAESEEMASAVTSILRTIRDDGRDCGIHLLAGVDSVIASSRGWISKVRPVLTAICGRLIAGVADPKALSLLRTNTHVAPLAGEALFEPLDGPVSIVLLDLGNGDDEMLVDLAVADGLDDPGSSPSVPATGAGDVFVTDSDLPSGSSFTAAPAAPDDDDDPFGLGWGATSQSEPDDADDWSLV